MSLAAPSRKPGCLSNLELDELLAGDIKGGQTEARLRGHLGDCVACSDRLAAFAALEPPPAPVAPPAPAAPREEARRPARERVWQRRSVLGAFGVFGCAAAVLIVWSQGGPTSAERTKGGLALTVFIKGAGGSVDTVQGEGRLHPGDEMRFSLSTAAAGHAVVLGLDTAPSVTVYAPAASGDATVAASAVRVESSGSNLLPGSIVADETAGAERVFAVLCPSPRDPQTLRAAALAALARAGGRPEAVRALDSGCLETSVLFHKQPRPR